MSCGSVKQCIVVRHCLHWECPSRGQNLRELSISMLPELLFAIIVFAAVFLLLFKSSLPARWKYLVQQTVIGGLIIWLLAVGWVAFSGLLEPAVGPRPVHNTMEQTRVSNLIQLMNRHPREAFFVVPAGQPQTFEVKGEVQDRNTNLTVNVTAYIDATRSEEHT